MIHFEKFKADYNLLAFLLLQFYLGKEMALYFPPTDFQLKQNLVACWSCWLFKMKNLFFLNYWKIMFKNQHNFIAFYFCLSWKRLGCLLEQPNVI